MIKIDRVKFDNMIDVLDCENCCLSVGCGVIGKGEGCRSRWYGIVKSGIKEKSGMKGKAWYKQKREEKK